MKFTKQILCLTLALVPFMPMQATQPAPQTRTEKIKTWVKAYGAPTALIAAGVAIVTVTGICAYRQDRSNQQVLQNLIGAPTIMEGIVNRLRIPMGDRPTTPAIEASLFNQAVGIYNDKAWSLLAIGGADNAAVIGAFANADAHMRNVSIKPIAFFAAVGGLMTLGGALWIHVKTEQDKKLAVKAA